MLPTRLHGIIKPQQTNESSIPNLRSNIGPIHYRTYSYSYIILYRRIIGIFIIRYSGRRCEETLFGTNVAQCFEDGGRPCYTASLACSRGLGHGYRTDHLGQLTTWSRRSNCCELVSQIGTSVPHNGTVCPFFFFFISLFFILFPILFSHIVSPSVVTLSFFRPLYSLFFLLLCLPITFTHPKHHVLMSRNS